jgi:hypothetical protein
VCEVNGDDVSDENVQEVLEGSVRCQESEPDMSTMTMRDDKFEIDEVAWDDVNNCPLDPVKVREARREEIEGLDTKVQGPHRKDAHQSPVD